MFSTVVFGADKFKKDEKIEVLYFDKWHPAVVLEVNAKGMVKAEHEYAGKPKQEWFKAEACRHEYEFGAIWRGRMWTDQSGKTKIKASLLKVEAKKVHLRTEKLKELAIDIEKLSEADKKFVQKLRENSGVAGSAMSQKMAAVEFDLSKVNRIEGIGYTRELLAFPEAIDLKLSPDPLRSSLKMTEGGVPFDKVSFGDDVTGIIPLGGEGKWLLASVQNTLESNVPTRLVWASLSKSKKQQVLHVLPSSETLLDYHAGSKQALTVASPRRFNASKEDNVLSVWKTSPAIKEAEAVISWKARFNRKEHLAEAGAWGKFVSGNLILQRDSDHQLVLWDIDKKTAVWATAQESSRAPEPLLSHNGKYLFLPEDSQVRILNPESGAMLAQIKTTAGVDGVAFHSDGKTLAILQKTKILIVDVTGENKLRVIDASGAAPGHPSRMEWVSDSMLAIQFGPEGFSLFSLELQLPIWYYEFEMSGDLDNESMPSHAIVDGHLVYSASKEDDEDFDMVMVFGAVHIPEKAVLDKLPKIQRKEYMLLGKGAGVRLKVEAGEANKQVQAAMELQIERNGWKIDPNSKFTLEAKIYTGSTQRVQYENRQTGDVTSVQITPIVSSIHLLQDQQIVWRDSTSTGFPPVIFLKQGSSVQEEVDSYQNVDIGFFSRSSIPAELFNSKMKTGLGISDATIKGLVPRSKK